MCVYEANIYVLTHIKTELKEIFIFLRHDWSNMH